MKMSLKEIAQSVQGHLSGRDQHISSVSIDTRTLAANDLYIAIKGENFDGHHFINKAEKASASAVLVEDEIKTDLPIIRVKDTRVALAELAATWKSKATVKTIAVTGSNGKTTVKEMIASILAINADVLFTQGNLNNEIGVPLTLLKLDNKHQYAVIEMGANHQGEIKYSCHYTKPDIAIVTNAGSAHIEGFGSLDGVAKAKGEIFQSLNDTGVAIINRDDDYYPLWKGLAENRKVVTFGLNKSANINAQEIIESIEENVFVTRFKLLTIDDEIEIKLKLAGKHNVINALAAAASCLTLSIKPSQIKQGLEKLKPVTGRLEPLRSDQGNLIINDTYNANPASMKVALNVLTQQAKEPWVILGAFGEMGIDSLKIHKEIGELIKSTSVIRLLTIGADAKSASDAFGKGATFFNSQEQLIATLKQELKGEETLLIKGSRTQKLENIVAALINNKG